MIQGNHPQESNQELPWAGVWACVLVDVTGDPPMGVTTHPGCVYTLLSTLCACHPPIGVTTLPGCVYTLLSTHCPCHPPTGVTNHPWVCLYLVEHPLCILRCSFHDLLDSFRIHLVTVTVVILQNTEKTIL